MFGLSLFQAFLALVGFASLIFFHELGHYLFARLNKVAVIEFAVGMGKVVWQRKGKTGTLYSLRLIPLGGFVRMAGDDYEAYYKAEHPEYVTLQEKAALAAQSAEKKEHFSLEPKDPAADAAIPHENWFFAKSIAARSAIVFAGPLFNFIMAWVLAFVVFTFFGFSPPNNEPVIGSLTAKYPAEEAGLLIGDKVTSVNGVSTDSWGAVVKNIQAAGADDVALIVERSLSSGQTEQVSLSLTPRPESREMQLVGGGEKGAEPRMLIGVGPSLKNEKIKLSPVESVVRSSTYLYDVTAVTVEFLYLLVKREISTEHIGGPLTVGVESFKAAQKGFGDLLMLVSVISISLAILNLFPIPVLDGGHLLFFAIEAIIGRKVSPKIIQYANAVGMFLILLLMLFAFTNDYFRYFG